MKLKEIIAKINPDLEIRPDEFICKEVGIEDLYYIPEQDRLKCYFIQRWLCTDTRVGLRVYFLDNEFICMSSQVGRKCDEEFTWINKECFYKCREYLLTFTETHACPTVNELILDEEFDEFYTVEYSSQILQKVGYWNNEKVQIIKTVFPWGNDDYFHGVIIQTKDNKQHKITVNQLSFKYNT